jgi:hypothetical protein
LNSDYYDENVPFLGMRSDFIFNNQIDPIRIESIIPSSYSPVKKTRLKDIYRVNMSDLERYLKIYNDPWERCFQRKTRAITHPVILSPSYSKLLYAQPIRDLFYGGAMYGANIDKLVIIGCSLAEYDRYIRQWLYYIKQQYFNYGADNFKEKILIINHASSCKEKRVLKKNYEFLGVKQIEVDFDGFSLKSLAKIFD